MRGGKLLLWVLVVGMLFTVFDAMPSEAQQDRYLVNGTVFNSKDGAIEIYNDTTGVLLCSNITVYPVEAEIETYVFNETTTVEEENASYDEFSFDAGWRSKDVGKEGVCIGEAVKDQVNYTFITNFTYRETTHPITEETVYRGRCNPTEWEPIPEPIIYLKGETWINLLIPKFKNPQISSLWGGTPNSNNTVGFAVYRDGEFINSTTSSTAHYYFYNDTSITVGQRYNYSVSPIARGDYVAWGKSRKVSSKSPARGTKISFISPTPGTSWTGGSSHNISYELDGGFEPYIVKLSYGTPTPFTLIEYDNQTAAGTYSYTWTVPKINTTKARVRIDITDDTLITVSSKSNLFEIDSSMPKVDSKKPTGSKVSIYDRIIIELSEPMNRTSVKQAFSVSPTVSDLSWDWKTRNKAIISHAPFKPNTTYTCEITTLAKDDSELGNHLAKNYSWQFTTTAKISASLLFPYPGAVLTGRTTQNITYQLGGGSPPYRVKVMFSEDGNVWESRAYLKDIEPGSHNCSWEVPILNTTTAQLKLNVTDIKNVSGESSPISFGIDSTPPTILAYSGSAGILRTNGSISITFSESMDNESVVESFSLKDATDTPINVRLIGWEDGKTVIFKPAAELTPNTNYTASFAATTAKDKSIPGNYLESYSWNFTAMTGKGDIVIIVSFPSAVKKGDTGTIKVTAQNSPSAWGYSGRLKVKFEQSEDGISWTVIDTKYIQKLKNGTSAEVSVSVPFDRYGNYYFLVTVTSDAPTDLLNGKSSTVSSASLVLTEEKVLGPGPYTLIVAMVVIVIGIGAYTLWSYRRKK